MAATTQASNKSNTKKEQNRSPNKKVEFAAPEGFKDQTSDVIGFYNPDVGDAIIEFTPEHAVVQDGKLEAIKPSILIFGTLVKPCKVVSADNEGGDVRVIEGKVGDLVGIWGKPGMKDLKRLAGVHVIMYPNGEKDTDKPNPMKLFKVLAKTRGKLLEVTEDRREKSKKTPHWLEVKADAPEPF